MHATRWIWKWMNIWFQFLFLFEQFFVIRTDLFPSVLPGVKLPKVIQVAICEIILSATKDYYVLIYWVECHSTTTPTNWLELLDFRIYQGRFIGYLFPFLRSQIKPPHLICSIPMITYHASEHKQLLSPNDHTVIMPRTRPILNLQLLYLKCKLGAWTRYPIKLVRKTSFTFLATKISSKHIDLHWLVFTELDDGLWIYLFNFLEKGQLFSRRDNVTSWNVWITAYHTFLLSNYKLFIFRRILFIFISFLKTRYPLGICLLIL